MTRGTPQLALSWTDGVHPKRYVSARSAYYAIAKRLVVEKYPAWLTEGDGSDGHGWERELLEQRAVKAFALFYADDGYRLTHFDDRRWKRFVTRVARFLAFVDRKRTTAELLELRFGGLLPAESIALAQAEHEACERASVQFAERARDIKAFITARSK